MRFRAKIVDVACLNHFSRVVNTIAKLAKTCTLRLTVSKVYFILADKVGNGGVSMWCELCQGNFFDEFQMEGVAAEHNEIYLELVPENLSRALKTAQSAKAVKMKLTNKHCPCLRVAVELPSLSSSSRIVTHDIPVGVIPRRLWNDFREPSVPDFDVSIYLPVLKTMKSVVERMKNLNNSIVIEANLSGEMNLKIETDLVSVTTHFKDLGNPPWPSEDGYQSSQDRDLESMAEARIDIKKLQQLLAGQQVNPTKALCNIVEYNLCHHGIRHVRKVLLYTTRCLLRPLVCLRYLNFAKQDMIEDFFTVLLNSPCAGTYLRKLLLNMSEDYEACLEEHMELLTV